MFLRSSIVFLILLLPIYLLPWYVLLPTVVIYPFLLYLPFSITYPNHSIKQGIKKGFKYGARSYITLFILSLLGLATVAVVFQPIAFVISIENEVPDLLDLIVKGISPFLDKAGLDSVFWTNLFREFTYLIALIFSLVFWFILLTLSYFSTLEKREALNLKKEGRHFGERSRLKEYIETEGE
jgi:hypothetical protein